jgi:hypothetical protein
MKILIHYWGNLNWQLVNKDRNEIKWYKTFDDVLEELKKYNPRPTVRTINVGNYLLRELKKHRIKIENS